MSEVYYPPTGFYFAVSVLQRTPQPNQQDDVDASFQEVSGLTAEFGFEEVTEGGENRYVHRLPKAAKYPNLVLKRGLVNTTSELVSWFSSTLTSGLNVPIQTKNLEIQLLDKNSAPLVTWSVSNAYPAKWEIAALNAQDNKILVETMELASSFFERRDTGAKPKQPAAGSA
jgi:phage tail-like protein